MPQPQTLGGRRHSPGATHLLHYVALAGVACAIDARRFSPGSGSDAGGARAAAGAGARSSESTPVHSGPAANGEDAGATTPALAPVLTSPAGGRGDADDAGAEPARGRVVWATHLPDSFVNGLAFDKTRSDALVCAGSYGPSLTLGEQLLVSAGGSDGYLARFNSDTGAILDATSFGGASDEGPLGVVGAADGTFAVQGYYASGVPNFGGADHVESPAGGLFVAVYDSALRLRWAKSFDGAGFGLTGNALDVNGSGAAIVAGSFQGTIDLGGTVLTSAGQRDAFFARFRGADGAVEQLAQFGTAAAESGSSALYLLGNYVIAGTFSSALEVGPGPALVPSGGRDIFIAAFSSAGTYQWRLSIGGTLDDGNTYMAADRAGNVYLCGSFQQTLQLGAATLETRGGSDIFLARLSATGVVEWAKSFGGGGNDQPRGIAASPLGVVALTGEFAGEIDFGGGVRASAGDLDAFVASFDANGDPRWDHTYGDTLTDRGLGVLVAEGGSVYANVEFLGSVNFGHGALDAGNTYDSVVLRYLP